MRVYVGENDCLLDESIRFLEKVVKAQHKDIKLVIYNMLRHGFLVFYSYIMLVLGYNTSYARNLQMRGRRCLINQRNVG